MPNKKIFLPLPILYFFFPIITIAQLPVVSTGKIIRFENFTSAYVRPRNIDIWLPENYSIEKKYAVLYMQDGQMLFDSATTWNHQEWDVETTVNRLVKQGKIKECIVVGIWNGGKYRHAEYFPQKPFESLPKQIQDKVFNAVRSKDNNLFADKIQSDGYLKFLVNELKPYIDKTYSVKTNAANTYIAGSSMGGLISLYAICEYPEIFGGAACLSTHWPGVFNVENNPIPKAFFDYLQLHIPTPKNHKIYFDFGTKTLDSLYFPYQMQVDRIMMSKGYNKRSWISLQFDGEAHSEDAWRKRLQVPLAFIMKKELF